MSGMQPKNSVNFGCSMKGTPEETQQHVLSQWKRLLFHRVEVLLLVECTTSFGCGMPQHTSFLWRSFRHMNVDSHLR